MMKPRLFGFTIIELLIVVTILTTVLGLGISSFNSFNRRERLKQTALTLKSNLRLAQAKAVAADKPKVGCSEFVGVEVRFTLSGYEVQHTCNPEGLVGASDFFSFPSGVTYVSLPESFSYQFPPAQAVTLTSDLPITLTNGSQSYRIVVSQNGNISDQGFL